MTPESITAAAIRFDGNLFTGKNHAEAIMNMEEVFPDWKTSGIKPDDGFVTSTGRYVKRDEAGRIAEQAEQLRVLPPHERQRAQKRLDSDWIN